MSSQSNLGKESKILNIYFHGLGVVGWTITGFVSKDKAILTNFGLQIPLFLIGIYKIII